jgi:very-short-patch-repair endonuclease
MPRQIKLLESEWPDLAEQAEVPGEPGPEDFFEAQMRPLPNLGMIRQYQFAKATIGRNWAFDFAFMPYHVAVEIEGLAVARRCAKCHPKELVVLGRHASIKGIKGDMEKYNTAGLLGWTVLRFQQQDVKPRHAYNFTLQVLAARGWRAVP